MTEERESSADEQLDAMLGALFRRLLGPEAKRMLDVVSRAAPVPDRPSDDEYPGPLEHRRELIPVGADARSPEHMIDALGMRLATLLEQRIKPSLIPLSHALWDSRTIAEYIRRNPKTISDVVNRLDFPKAIRIPTRGESRGHPLWKASEVIAWVLKHQDGAPGRIGRPRKPY